MTFIGNFNLVGSMTNAIFSLFNVFVVARKTGFWLFTGFLAY